MSAKPPLTRRLLRIEIPGRDEYEVELTAGRRILGRAADCDIPIEFERVSQAHCAIERRDGKWWIVDLESRNGTTLGDRDGNDLDVVEITDTAAPLQHGDVIRLGREVRIDFIDPDKPAFLGKDRDGSVDGDERDADAWDPEAEQRLRARSKRANALLAWTWTVWFGSGILLGAWAILVVFENWIRP